MGGENDSVSHNENKKLKVLPNLVGPALFIQLALEARERLTVSIAGSQALN